ncbi:MAG: NAD-dependent epimerase/dehydratase family protein [Candidatus Dadabacteria bacterium]|nr:MAG: NAD-dependent epimerase/dehydratase family protein [Candidatus Dadabacteria bacterium]
MSYWRQKSVLVTGGRGFLGRAVCRLLEEAGCRRLVAVGRAEADLCRQEETERLMHRERPDVVVHLAGSGRGIADHLAGPARDAYANLAMGLHVVEAARISGVEKLVYVASADAYPRRVQPPYRETQLWEGLPDPSHAAYGIAKRAMHIVLEAYRRQYGLKSAYLVSTNLYGPGADFTEGRAHVVAALVRRFCEAAERGAEEVVCWGTGSATRDFLYVDDAAVAVLRAGERIDAPAPINIASGTEVSIGRLAETIAALCGYQGRIRFDPSKPEGPKRRCLDVARARRLLDFQPTVGLEEGLRRTIAWWRATRPSAAVVP